MNDFDHIRRQLARITDREQAGTGSTSREQHAALIKPRWRAQPFTWARERLGIPLKRWANYDTMAYRDHRWDGTPDPLAAAADALGRGFSASVSSATGVGKTFLAAVVLLWWLDCWPGSEVVTLAPKEDQLEKHLWKEVAKLMPMFLRLHPTAELMHLELRMRAGAEGKDWRAYGYPVGVAANETVASKAQGAHNEHLLFILEETPGIHDSILLAIEMTCVATHNLRLYLGNPNSDQDSLAKASRSPGVVAIRASALDHPNVVLDDAQRIPGACSRMSIERLREKYGEDNPLYQSRVRGIAPGQATEALIRREWLEASATMSPEKIAQLSRGQGALGADLAASEGGDQAAYAYGRGACLAEVRTFPCPDPNFFARERLFPFIESLLVKSTRLGIDPIGVGMGAVGELKRLGVKGFQLLNGGHAYWKTMAKDGEEFGNLRCQMWWQLRLDLQAGKVHLPKDEELWRDLTAPTWETRSGKIWVESKESFKTRLGRSPDRADAVVYWNWVRQASKGLSFADLPPARPVPLS